MNFTIRLAKKADLPRILEIYNHAVLHSTATFDTEPKTLEDREQWWSSRAKEHPVCVVVREDSEILAWGSLSPWSDRRGYRITAEPSLYVDERFQGQGIGRELMRWLVEAGKEAGFQSLISRIADANAISIALHERFGFRKAGQLVQVGEKFGKLLDVMLYQLLLKP